LTEGGIAIAAKKEINLDRSCTKRDTYISTDEGGYMPKSLSIIEARKKLTNIPELFEQEADLDVVAITRRGRPVMAIMSWDLYEALEETLEILGDEALMMQLRESIAELKAGQLIPWEEIGAGAGR
jgi:prevent-host-death family protein